MIYLRLSQLKLGLLFNFNAPTSTTASAESPTTCKACAAPPSAAPPRETIAAYGTLRYWYEQRAASPFAAPPREPAACGQQAG
ncbi:MAG: hypothetical protein EOO12_02590 [Chitinophagaceae bacterium]|nr:MAG: hypothetical protein EOO12_02590 [Chitinophagaceae bacterium]